MKKIKILCLMLCLVILSGTLVKNVFAKYASEDQVTAQVDAAKFYFSMNIVNSSGTLIFNSGTTSVQILLKNHEDNANYADIPIDVDVKVLEESGDSFADASGITVSYDIGQTISPGSGQDVTATISNLESGKTYKIIATGSKGYHKQLSEVITVL